MKIANASKTGDSKLFTPKKMDRWKHVKATLGKFKGSFEHRQADSLVTRHHKKRKAHQL